MNIYFEGLNKFEKCKSEKEIQKVIKNINFSLTKTNYMLVKEKLDLVIKF